MREGYTIGEVARRSGVPVRSIRFYEAEGVIPSPGRSEGGYRLYTATDVRRLQLVRRVRLLGLPLPEAGRIVAQAFASECSDYGQQVLDLVERQRAELDRRIAELQTLRSELDAVAAHVRHALTAAPPGLTVAACGRCPLIDDGGGGEVFCGCAAPATPHAAGVVPLTLVDDKGSDSR